MQSSIGHMDMYSRFSGAPELSSNASKTYGFATNNLDMPQIVTQQWILPSVSQCQMRLANMLCWIYHTTTQDVYWKFSGALQFRSYGSKSYRLLQIHHLVSRILTQQLHIAWTDCIAIWDWQIFSTWFVVTRLMTVPKVSPPHLTVDNILISFFCDPNVYVSSDFQGISNLQLPQDLKPITAACSTFDSCHSSWDRAARNV